MGSDFKCTGVDGYRGSHGDESSALGTGLGFFVPSTTKVTMTSDKFESIFMGDIAEVRPPCHNLPHCLQSMGWMDDSVGINCIFTIIGRYYGLIFA